MPTTYNGIGTWYYGKRNVHRLKGSCPHCHRIGELESYDTTLYFVAFLIPIIPLKKKRVLEKCPSCEMHRVLDLDKWEESKQKAVAEVLDKLRDDPDNREVILEALGMSTFFQDQVLFEKLATLATDKTGDAEIQAALAAGYSYYSQRDKAIEAYKHSLIADDNPEVRRHLAINFLRMGDPEQAEPLLRHVWETPDSAGLGHVQLLVEAYRSHGKHQEAIRVMDFRDAAFPEFAKQKDVQNQRYTSVKNLLTGKPIRGAASLTDTGRSGTAPGGKVGGGIAKWVFPAILVLLLIGYVGVAIYKGQNRKVYLVNGTKQPYSVIVNGGPESKLLPEVPTAIRVAEGELEVKVNGAPIDSFRVTVETGFWGRPFRSPVIVINPDRIAWVVEEEAHYAENNPPPNPPPTFHFGKKLYYLPGVNFEFEEFPRQLQLEKGSSVTRTRVGLERGLTAEGRVQLLNEQNVPASEKTDCLKRLVTLTPNEPTYFQQLIAILSPAESFDFLKAGLVKRPLAVEWHQAYQMLTEKVKPETDLRPEYETLLAEVGSADAKYLLAQIVDDPLRARKLVAEGAKEQPQSPYCLFSLGYHDLVEGKFAEAIESLKAAYNADPNRSNSLKQYRDALWAAKKYDQLATVPNLYGNDPIGQTEQLRIAAAKGDLVQFNQIKEQLLRHLGSPAFGGLTRGLFDGVLPMTRGDVKGFLRVQAGLGGEKSFAVLILEGKTEEAVAAYDAREHPLLIAGDPSNVPAMRGLLYLFTKRDKLDTISKKQWEAMLESLVNRGAVERRLAEMLSGKRPFDLQRVLSSTVEPELKRVLLLVFAERFPDAKKELTALARQLDFQRDVYSLCLKQLTEKK